MGLNIQKKQELVFKVSKIMQDALSVVVASLDGVTSNEVTILRNICRKNNVYICVVRNTLVCRAFKNSVFESLRQILVGPNIIAFSTVESSDCIKIFARFSKENTKFRIKGVVFDGIFFDESKIDWLSSLPKYKDCIINLMFVIRECVLGKFMRMLDMLCKNKKN